MIQSLLAQASGELSIPVVIGNTLVLLARYLHIVCTTLLVGGTLFFEMVVPIAIDDLKPEQQLAIFARARWVFRRIVWFSVTLFVITGITSTFQHWKAYTHPEQFTARYVSSASDAPTTAPATTPTTAPTLATHAPAKRSLQPLYWWMAHVVSGATAMSIALMLTIGRTPPSHPVRWMRLNMVVLMIVIFLASATRQVRLTMTDPPSTSNTRAAQMD